MSHYSKCLSPLQEKGCAFHHLLASTLPVLQDFTGNWRDSGGEYQPGLRLCEAASTPLELELTRLVLGTKADICFTGYVCHDHEQMVICALETYATDLSQIEGGGNTCYYPLTRKEINGIMDLAPEPDQIFASEGEASMIWQEVTLPGYVINGLGGRTAVTEDEAIRVSYYVFGHTDPALVTDKKELNSLCWFPVLEVMAHVPTEFINGTGGAEWLPKTLLQQSRRLPTYKDGVTETGMSMFELRAKSLREEIDGFLLTEGEEAANATVASEPFKPTPAKQRPAIPVIDRPALIDPSPYEGHSVWEKYAAEILTDTREVTASPGKPLQYVPQLPSSASDTVSSEKCRCGRPLLGDGTNMCECGVITRPSFSTKQPLQPNASQRPADNFDTAAIIARFQQSLEAATAAPVQARGGASNTACATSPPNASVPVASVAAPVKKAGGGSGGGSSGGSDSDSSEDSIYGGGFPHKHLLIQAQAIRKGFLDSLEDPRFEAVAKRAATLQSVVLATTLSEVNRMQLALQASQQAHAEKLAQQATSDALLVDVRKKENEKFPVGNAKLIDLLQRIGQHGDQTGFTYPVLEQIAHNVDNGDFYKALVVSTEEPRTKSIYTFQVTPHWLYNISACRFGGAASATGVMPEFAGGLSITDFIRKEPARPTFRGVVHLNTEVPAKGKITFLTDEARQLEEFKSIYEFEDAFNALARVIGVAFGPAWHDPFVACGQTLKALYLSNPQVYHLRLLRWLADAGLLDWIQTLRMMASNKDYQLSRARCDLARAKGFLMPTVIPGDGFKGVWLKDNLLDPFNADMQALVRGMVPQTEVARLHGNFSSIPHASKPLVTSGAATALARPNYAGARRPVRVGDDNLEEEDVEYETEHLGAKGGKGARPAVAALVTGRGSSFTPVKPLVTMPGHQVAQGYKEVPHTVDPQGNPLGPACLRFYCFGPLDPQGVPIRDVSNNCPANNPRHPLFTPGSVCSKSHAPLAGPMSYTTAAVALSLGGLRVPQGAMRPPRDPVQLQRLSEIYRRNAANNVPLTGPASVAVPPDSLSQSALGSLMLGDDDVDLTDEMWDLLEHLGHDLGYEIEPETAKVSGSQATEAVDPVKAVEVVEEELGEEEEKEDAKVQWRGANFTSCRPPKPGECTRVGQAAIKHIPYTFEVLDVGSLMDVGATKSRGKSCLLNTLGALFEKYGYPAAEYRKQALTEFDRTDVTRRQEYAEFAAALRDVGTLKLGMLVHMAVPQGVALIVVQRRPGQAAKLMIFTNGQAEVVEFAIINNGHIMPMVCSHSPCSAILWRDFEPVLAHFRESKGFVVTKHTSRSLPVRQGTRPSAGLGPDETLGEQVEDVDTRDDTDLQVELGVDDDADGEQDNVGSRSDVELQGDMALQQQVADELRKLMGFLQAETLTSAQAVANHIRANGQIWIDCPILLGYYNLRVKLGSFAQQHCDVNTQSFLHWLWHTSGTMEMPHPFPHFLRSVVASLANDSGLFAVSLFVALATTTLDVEDAAALVVVNLPECDHGRYPTPNGRHLLAQRLCAVYDLLADKMGGTKVIHGHLFVRNAQEWNVRVADGGYELQTAWLYRYLKTYELYLIERSRDVGFFSKGAFDQSPEAIQQRRDRSKQMHDRLSREAANMKSLVCADIMKGCWQLNVPFVRPLDVRSPSLARTGKNTPAKATTAKKPVAKRPRLASQQDDESTDAGSGSTAGWNGYVANTYVECGTGPMRSPQEISEDWIRKYPPSAKQLELREARDRRHALRGSTYEQSIDLTASPEALVSLEALLSPEVVLPPEDKDDELRPPSRSQSTADPPVIKETAAEVMAMAITALVSPNTLDHQVAGLGMEQEPTSDAKAAKGSVEETESEEEVVVMSKPFEPTKASQQEENQEASFVLEAESQNRGNEPVIEKVAEERVLTNTEANRGCTFPNDGQHRYRPGPKKRDGPGKGASQRRRPDEDDPDDDTWAHIELSGAEEDEQSDARQKEALAAAQDMLKHNSPEVLELQPLVNQLKEAAAALKSALVSKEPAREERRNQLQGAYLVASNSLCHAAVALCNNNRWPQLFLAAYRASHPGRVNPLVDPTALRQAFEGLIDDTVLRTIVAQATEGQEVYLSRPKQSGWPRETPTAKMYKDEIWRTVWTDAAYESTFVFGPECKQAMDLANMQGYPLHRIPKRDTATGQPTGKGRLIADLSFENKEGHSINSMTLIDLYDKFRMPTHADIARDIMLLRHWFPKLDIVISKLDVARAFRQKLLSVGSFGVFAFLLSGHICVDQAFVFGHSAAPAVYASSGQAIHEGHNASGMHFSGEELREAGYVGYENLSPQDKRDGIWINFFSRTYCDDGILVALTWKPYQDASMASYKKFMVAALGPEAVSDKNPEEQEWRERQTVIGHVFSLGEEPDERGDKDFLSPTPERIQRMLLVMSDSQFTSQGKDTLTAGLCAKAFSLWLWMCIPCPRCKAFIGSFKRVFEGKKKWSAEDIVSPVRLGDDPTMAWQMFWDDMLTLKTILGKHLLAPGFFRVPLFRLLSEDEQLLCYGERFDTIATDACQIGGGGFCYTGKHAGCYFRVAFPEWVVKDIKSCMEKGHSEGDSSQYTIAVVEKAMHTLGMILYGETGQCYVMLQDNQNVVDWVRKGWSKPVRVQNYMRRDVMVARHRDMWAAIQYIHTKDNKLADWLSRSFTDTGADNHEVLAEFHMEVARLGLVATETPVSTELLSQLLSKQVERCDLNRLESYVIEFQTPKESVVTASTRLDRQVLHHIDIVRDEEALHRIDEVVGNETRSDHWKSERDEPDDDEWWSLELGARTRTTHKRQQQVAAKRNHSVPPEVSGEFEVDKILKVRTHEVHGVQYRVRFCGYNNTHNRWVRPADCEISELIVAFKALVGSRGDLPAECTKDTEAEQFYYAERPEAAQSVNRAPHLPPVLEHRGQVSKGPGPGAWQRGGRGHTSNLTDANATQRHMQPMILQPIAEAEARGAVNDDQANRNSNPNPYGNNTGWQPHTMRSRSVFRDGLMTSAVNSTRTARNHPTVSEELGRPPFHRGGNKGAGKGGKGSAGAKGRNDYAELQGSNRGFMGPSLVEQAAAAAAAGRRGGRQRVELYIGPNDDLLRRAAAETLVNSMAPNTRKTYGDNLKFFLGFCERQSLSPILDGSDKRGEEARLIEYVMYEYAVHGNKYSTIKIKLYAIRAATMDEGYPNPLENKPTLARHMKGIKALRGATDSKEPLPPEAFRNILRQTQGKSILLRATALAIAIGFFFLLRISEFAARDKWYMEVFILLRQDVTFFQNGLLCAWDHPRVDAVELHIRGSKTDQRKQGCRRMQQASGDPILCPVRCMVEWFALTEGSSIPSTAPLFSIPLGRDGSEWKVLTRETVTLLMKGAAVDCGLKPKYVATHSIRISGATALLIAGVPAEVVKIMGRWISNAFIGYTRYQAELMAGIAQRMVNTSYVVRPF